MRVLVNGIYSGEHVESTVDLYALALWYCLYSDKKVTLTTEPEDADRS